MIIREMPEAERPREKLMQHGSASLANRELIAILLGSGTKEKSALKIADELLVLRGSGLRDLCYLTAADLSKIKGIGTAKASVPCRNRTWQTPCGRDKDKREKNI